MADDLARIQFDGVTVDFGATRALDDIRFSIRPGEIVGLLGHNGAGKSTLFNVTTGVIGATRGAFSVDGSRIEGRLTPRQAANLGITVIHRSQRSRRISRSSKISFSPAISRPQGIASASLAKLSRPSARIFRSICPSRR